MKVCLHFRTLNFKFNLTNDNGRENFENLHCAQTIEGKRNGKYLRRRGTTNRGKLGGDFPRRRRLMRMKMAMRMTMTMTRKRQKMHAKWDAASLVICDDGAMH